MITVFFEDDGQDFLEWDINDKGEVVDCRPYQGNVWIGVKVVNKDIKPGDRLEVIMPSGIHRTITHAVDKVQEIA
jgi:hypothetical protein